MENHRLIFNDKGSRNIFVAEPIICGEAITNYIGDDGTEISVLSLRHMAIKYFCKMRLMSMVKPQPGFSANIDGRKYL
jgi:hypothetical protein